MEKFNLAYLAGVMDCDGSFSGSHGRDPRSKHGIRSRFVFQLTWKQSPSSILFIEQLKKQYGGSIFVGIHNTNIGRTSIVKYGLESNIKLKNLIDDVLPYLRLKQQQALVVLDVIEYRVANNCQGRPRTFLEIGNELTAVMEIHNLNGSKSHQKSH